MFSCCPTNVARTLASLGSYFATSTVDGVQVHQYAAGEVSATLAGGVVAVRVETNYPTDGEIRFVVTETICGEWELSLRVPAWARTGASLRTNGETRDVAPGTVSLRRAFEIGDQIILTLPVDARWTAPDPRIDALRGQLAVERGPLVMCLESTDIPSSTSVDDLRATGGIRDSGGEVTIAVHRMTVSDHAWPYGVDTPEISPETEHVRLQPYHSWANRGPSTMRVWLPVDGNTVSG